MSGHTYDKWQELGFQVKKGEKYAYKYYGKYIFTRDQVVKVKNSEYKNYSLYCSHYRSDELDV